MKINKLRTFLARFFVPSTHKIITYDEFVSLTMQLNEARASSKARLSKQELTMLELGSYLPSFVPLMGKSDDFKSALGLVCDTINQSQELQYLFDHIKQDQVNKSLFTEGVSYTDDFVRGSINGIYVCEEQIKLLGLNWRENVKKGLAK